jgi:hypothetical protein
MIKCNICISINCKRPKNMERRHNCNLTCLDGAPSRHSSWSVWWMYSKQHVLRCGIEAIRKIKCAVSHAATTKTYGGLLEQPFAIGRGRGCMRQQVTSVRIREIIRRCVRYGTFLCRNNRLAM